MPTNPMSPGGATAIHRSAAGSLRRPFGAHGLLWDRLPGADARQCPVAPSGPETGLRRPGVGGRAECLWELTARNRPERPSKGGSGPPARPGRPSRWLPERRKLPRSAPLLGRTAPLLGRTAPLLGRDRPSTGPDRPSTRAAPPLYWAGPPLYWAGPPLYWAAPPLYWAGPPRS